MKCRDFKRRLNEQLDAREGPVADVERAMEDHALACPGCRLEASRYQTLRRAIAAWGPPPTPSAGFVERVLAGWQHAEAAVEEPAPPRILRFWPILVPAAMAASLLLSVLIGVRPGVPARPAKPLAVAASTARAIDHDALSHALAVATSATWDLARATSAPAARVGLEVFEATGLDETSDAPTMPLEVEAEAVEVLQDVGERVNEGVRPLSGTARQAFGFLFGPAPAPPQLPPPLPRGA